MIRRSLAVLALLALTGCMSPVVKDTDLIQSSYQSADHLMAVLDKTPIKRGTVLYTSLVDIKDVETSSRFGQILAEQMSSRFAQQHYAVSEARLRNNLAITSDGEFILSRNWHLLANQQTASAVLVGTYAVGANSVLVSTRVIDLATSRVVASDDFTVPLGPDVKRLVGGPQETATSAKWLVP